jgi:hypothetical protein
VGGDELERRQDEDAACEAEWVEWNEWWKEEQKGGEGRCERKGEEQERRAEVKRHPMGGSE